MLTYQDYEKQTNGGTTDVGAFLLKAIREHQGSDMFLTAQLADLYDHQRNKTINEYQEMLYKVTGQKVANFTASNAKLASNYFHKLTRQRCTYSLGNGVRFTQHIAKEADGKGGQISHDRTKEALPKSFDKDLYKLCRFGLIHGLSFGFHGRKRMHVFPVTQLAPLWDRDNGRLRAAVRFWRLDDSSPLIVEFYEEEGVSVWAGKDGSDDALTLQQERRAYKQVVAKAPIEDEPQVVSEENYGSLPVVPFWGSELHQSLLIGNQQTIDSYDLIHSGFANDLRDCSQIFFLLENFGGMSPQDLEKARDMMLLTHMISMDSSNGGKITPYQQEIPHEAREKCLNGLRSQLYEDMACLDVHTIAAGATNDHIDAAYQPVDDAADDFEYQVSDFLEAYLALDGIEDQPDFKRNRISNQKEQTEMVTMARDDLDQETYLNKLPFITPDEVPGIMARKAAEDAARYQEAGAEDEDDDDDPDNGPEKKEKIEEVVL